MVEINEDKLQMVVDNARVAAENSPRWLRAIERAQVELTSNPYIAVTEKGLLILSSTSSNIYTSNGSCECKAFEFGKPCWHRAAARLVQRYYESAEQSA
jgi:hypothetical protein